MKREGLNINMKISILILFLFIAFPSYAQLNLEEKEGGGLHLSGDPKESYNQDMGPADNTPEQRFLSDPDGKPPTKWRQKRRNSSTGRSSRSSNRSSKNLKPIEAVKANCAKKWGSNYKMQKHCIERQVKGAREISALTDKYKNKRNSEEVLIIGKCGEKWEGDLGGWNYPMLVHCSKQQIKAYHNLR